MPVSTTTPSARETELLELAYAYVLEHGISDLSLRPLATAIGSSPRVLLFLFDSKDGLVRRLLARARQDELEGLADPDGRAGSCNAPLLHPPHPKTGQTDVVTVRYTQEGDLSETVRRVWAWLSDPAHTGLLRLWTEAYARSLTDPAGPWGDFARDTVDDWLRILAAAQPPAVRRTARGRNQRTAALALLRGAMLDLLATGDRARVDRAVAAGLGQLTHG